MNRLSDRKRDVLFAVVEDFIASAEPVGSQQVSKKGGLEISSATIRIVMAELEERGFLKRSHVSSGRIPTDTAYRFYVNELMKLEPLTSGEREQIRSSVESGKSDMNEIIHQACQLISAKANQPSLGLVPANTQQSLKHIQFIRLRENLILTILVSSTGIVENKLLELERPLSQSELDRMHNYLNERLAGLTIGKVREQILLEMKRVQSQYDEVLNRALLLADRAFSSSPAQFHVEGQSKLCDDPEFADVTRMQQILRTLEEKTAILRVLDQSLASPGVKIFIGEEVQCPEVNGLALIASSYSDAQGNRGVLGVLGPTRIHYARIVPLVEFTSSIVTEALKDRS